LISEADALALWRKALTDPIGLAVRTDHRRNLMSRLYNVRAKSKDDEIYALKIELPLDEAWLWIRRKPQQMAPVKQLTEADLDSL
jgi:hypothetical protein